MKTVFLFPGQGAQYPGMCKDLYDSSQAVRELFEHAGDLVKKDTKKLLFESSEEELKETVNTQISVTLANLSAARVLQERGVLPEFCAGFSLGEFAALTITGVLRVDDVFPLVKIRGELMARTAESLDRTEGAPGMAAVMGLGPEMVNETLKSLKRNDIFCANFNSPVQTVISGTASGLKVAEEALKSVGAKRVIVLKVSGPFHSPLLAEASQNFRQVLKDVSFRDPSLALFSNVTGAQIDNGLVAKELAAQQIISPVRWTDEEDALMVFQPDAILETGPGTVLAGLWKAKFPDSVCFASGNLEAIEKLPLWN